LLKFHHSDFDGFSILVFRDDRDSTHRNLKIAADRKRRRKLKHRVEKHHVELTERRGSPRNASPLVTGWRLPPDSTNVSEWIAIRIRLN